MLSGGGGVNVYQKQKYLQTSGFHVDGLRTVDPEFFDCLYFKDRFTIDTA